jgi:hypothetical protein
MAYGRVDGKKVSPKPPSSEEPREAQRLEGRSKGRQRGCELDHPSPQPFPGANSIFSSLCNAISARLGDSIGVRQAETCGRLRFRPPARRRQKCKIGESRGARAVARAERRRAREKVLRSRTRSCGSRLPGHNHFRARINLFKPLLRHFRATGRFPFRRGEPKPTDLCPLDLQCDAAEGAPAKRYARAAALGHERGNGARSSHKTNVPWPLFFVHYLFWISILRQNPVVLRRRLDRRPQRYGMSFSTRASTRIIDEVKGIEPGGLRRRASRPARSSGSDVGGRALCGGDGRGRNLWPPAGGGEITGPIRLLTPADARILSDPHERAHRERGRRVGQASLTPQVVWIEKPLD